MNNMHDWLLFAFFALLLYGLWAFFPKLGSNYIGAPSFIIYETLGVMIATAVIFVLIGFKPEFHTKGMVFAMLAGLAGIVGTLFFVYALIKGKASVVVTMTALYPLVTILLASVILKEAITLKQGVGIIFALVAMVLFSI